MLEKGCFEAKRDSRESRLGVKICLFRRKKVLFDSVKGRLGVIFQTPLNMSYKKACLGVNLELFGGKVVRKVCVFPGEIKGNRD